MSEEQQNARIHRARSFKPANLAAYCQRLNIPTDHHNALSDALACAQLYLMRNRIGF